MQTIIVEVTGFEGEDGAIVVLNRRAGLDEVGREDALYCVARVDEDGVFRLVDFGYATPAEARRAWPEVADMSEVKQR